RQRWSDRFRERSMLFPIALGIYGVVLLTDTSEHHAVSVTSAVLLVLSALASVGFGVIRGRTIELFERGGELWERASWTTIGVGRWPPRRPRRVDWRSRCDRSEGRGVADLDPAHAHGHARGADVRCEAACEGFGSAHGAFWEMA